MYPKPFLLWILLLVPLLSTSCSSFFAQRSQTRQGDALVPISQGTTSATQTHLSILIPKGERYSYILRNEKEDLEIAPSSRKILTYPHSPWGIEVIQFRKLSPKLTYHFKVLNANGELLDSRWLRTLDTTRPSVRFLVVSCMDTHLEDIQRKIWPEALERSADLLFIIGDSIYPDRKQRYTGETSPELIWKTHVESRLNLHLYRTKTLIPIFATWDDHDYGVNNGDSSFKHKEESARIFQNVFAQAPIPGTLEKGPGVASHLQAFRQDFYFMDNRSFRSPDITLKPKYSTHWGKEQEDWLNKKLREHTDRPAWIINGDQFFGAYHRWESYEKQHPHSFKKFLNQLKTIQKPIIFISGDRHLAELQLIPKKFLGYPTYEITSSGIHAKVFPSHWKKYPNPLQIEGQASKYNYAWIESRSDRRTVSFKLKALGLGKQTFYERNLKVSNP